MEVRQAADNPPEPDVAVNLASAPLVRASNDASIILNRVAEPRSVVSNLAGGTVSDPTSAVATGLLAKLLPAGLGAALFVLVDPPEDRKELFTRVFIGLVAGGLFTEVTIDVLHGFAWFAMLDPRNVWHVVAVAGVWGGIGWFIVGAMVTGLKRLRADPVQAIVEAKRDLL